MKMGSFLNASTVRETTTALSPIKEKMTLLRNVPPCTALRKKDRLRQHLELGPESRTALYQDGLQFNRGLERSVCAAAFAEQDFLVNSFTYNRVFLDSKVILRRTERSLKTTTTFPLETISYKYDYKQA